MAMKPRPLALLNLLFLAVMIAVNALANILPINGYNTGQVSAFYPNLFVPAGFTFSIWSIIYLLLILFTLQSIRWLWYRPDSIPGRVALQLSPWFIASCILNFTWILAWHYLQAGLSVLIMLVFLLLLIRTYLSLQAFRGELSASQRFWLYIPFVVYLGWISVATIANITAWLVSRSWGGFGLSPVTWSVIMVTAAILLGLVFAWKRRDFAYALVVSWALFGIYSAHHTLHPAIGNAALAGITALLFSVAYRVITHSRTARS
jgi:translocator protein